MKKYPSFVVGVFLLSLSTNVFAEPTEVIQGLMKMRLSAFDFGLYRLGEHLTTPVRYNSDGNRIEINAILGFDRLSPSEIEHQCRAKIADIKGKLGVVNGEALLATSIANTFFIPLSISSDRMSESASQEIDNLIEIGCTGLVGSSDNPKVYKCKSMLRSEDVLCGSRYKLID